MQNTIACALYDYIEIACMFHYQVVLTLDDGSMIEGEAQTVEIIDKREFVVLQTNASPERTCKADTAKLVKLEVLSVNPRFKEVIFK